MQKKKLAIVSTHPIQYYAPLFRALAASPAIDLRVFYTWEQARTGAINDAGFGIEIQWDIPLLDGYEYEFVPNVAKDPGVHHFWGIRNPTLVRSLRDWDPEAVLVFGWNLASHLQVMRKSKGRVPLFFRGDSTLLDATSAGRRLARKWALSWVYGHIDVAIAVGQNNRDYYVEHGVAPERVAFAPHAVDVQRFANDELYDEAAGRWRRELGIGPSEVAVLYAGKLIAKKDPLLLLEAFKASELGAHLIFCGNGALEGELREQARCVSRVHFLPFQNQVQMPVVYRLGDVFVLPSRGPGETWGLALNEAMACGRPVIASSKVGGARDLVQQGTTGWAFEAGNVSELQRVLAQAVSLGVDALAALGMRARETSMQWSIEVAAERISQVVTQFTARSPERKVSRPARSPA